MRAGIGSTHQASPRDPEFNKWKKMEGEGSKMFSIKAIARRLMPTCEEAVTSTGL